MGENGFSFHLNSFGEILLPVVIVFLSVFFGLIIRKIIFMYLGRWAAKTKTEVDDIVIDAIKGPFIIWFLMIGIFLGLKFSLVQENIVEVIDRILMCLGIFSVTLVLSTIATRLIKSYGTRFESAFPVTSLTQNIARILIFSIGILILLNSLGVSIAPILATLGVGGLAVALALQDTLSNLFAGVHLSIAKQIKVGDYIKLSSGEEGYVSDITWRSTKIKMLSNNVVLIPNDALLKLVVVNYHLPENELAVLVDLGVHYDSDLKKVEEVTIEVARDVMKSVPGGIPGFEPFIRYHTLGDFSINFSVIMRGKEFVDQYLIKHEFIKRLQERYKKENIIIPYPIRAINYTQEKSENGRQGL